MLRHSQTYLLVSGVGEVISSSQKNAETPQVDSPVVWMIISVAVHALLIFVFSGHQVASQHQLKPQTLFVQLNHSQTLMKPDVTDSGAQQLEHVENTTEVSAETKVNAAPVSELHETLDASETATPPATKAPQIATKAIEAYYYKSSELTDQPYPLNPSTPEYPPRAIANNTDGWVRLLIKIEENGEVAGVEVLESFPVGEFEEAAIANFRFTKFSPGIRDGKSVKSRIILKVKFSIDELNGRQKASLGVP